MLRNLIVLPDGTEIFSGNPRGNAVASAEYRQKVNSGAELTIGSVCASCLSMKLIAGGGNLSIGAGTEFSYYKVSDNGERTKIGLFTMEKPTRSGANSYQIEAYDRVSWLDKDLSDWLSSLNGWPYSVESFARMVCEACGLTLEAATLPNGKYQIRKFSGSGVTGRMLMQWLGQITCRFIRANADGEIEFAWYSDKGKEITTRGEFAYFGGGLSYEDFKVSEIQKVQIKASENDNGTVYPDGNEEELNTYKITGNYLLTAETGDELKPVARAIFEQLQGVTYTPCKVSIQATTEINAGDIVHITDRNGVTITTYVMSKTNKGQKDTLECTGSYMRDSSTATNTLTMKALNGKVLLIEKSVDGLIVENKDTAGKVAKLELSTTEITASVESVKKTSDEALKEARKNATDLTNYATQVSGSLTDLQNQIDGAIETWFDNYEPTTANAPASSWKTAEDKNKHLGDLFYIVDNEDKGGLVYRWALTNGVYGWVLVEDTEVAKALETASQAKDTADGKRRVFVTQPNPPYDVGDLWTNNTDLYVCQTARATGNYTASDWKLATEYTTEKAVKALIEVAEESITLQVQSVEKKVDGIEVGGRNLLFNSKGDFVTDPDDLNHGYLDLAKETYYHGIKLDAGQPYILSYDWSVDWKTTTPVLAQVLASIGVGETPGQYTKDIHYAWNPFGETGNSGRAVVSFTPPGNVLGERPYFAFRLIRTDTSDLLGDSVWTIRNIQLEKGNRPTDWTPAPEDTETEIAGVKKEVSALKVTSKGVDMVSEDSNGRLVSFIGNRDTGGVWEAKYTDKNDSVISGVYFDFAKGSFVFDGHVVARSGEIGGCLIVGGNLQVPAANIEGTLTASQIDATDLHVKAANIDGKLTFGSAYYIDPSATTNYLMLPGLEITSSGASFTGAIKGGSININDRFKVDALGNVTLPDNASISWGQVDNKPTNLATTDDIPNDDYITRITEDTVRTSNVVAKNLIVKAANIEGTLTASQIDISVGGRNYFTTAKRLKGEFAYMPGTVDFSNPDCPNGFYVVGDKSVESVLRFNDVITDNGEWTLSWEMRGSQSTAVGFRVDICDIDGGWFLASADNNWTSHSLTIDVTNYTADLYNFVDFSDINWAYIYVRNIKLEKGNTATDWTPAPEDTEATVTKITNDTIATTNVVAQNLHVKAANIDGALTFGNGSYYIDPGATTTYLSLPGITVNKDGTTVEGKLVTTAGGRVGGFFVDAHQLGITTNTKGDLYIGRYGLMVTEPSVNNYWLFYASVDNDKVYAKNLYIKGATSYNLNISADRISFVFNDTELGRIETYSTSVKLVGTWLGTSSQAITSDAGKKHDILDLDDRYNTLFDLIRPVAYKYNDGTSDRYHTGFIANEVEDALEKAGISTQEFAGFVVIDEKNGGGTTAKTRCLRYEEFIAVLWSKVKQLEKTLEAMKYATH